MYDSHILALIVEAVQVTEAERQRPSVMFKAKLQRSSMGNSTNVWTASYGDLVVFNAATPEEAMRKFDIAWKAQQQ